MPKLSGRGEFSAPIVSPDRPAPLLLQRKTIADQCSEGRTIHAILTSRYCHWFGLGEDCAMFHLKVFVLLSRSTIQPHICRFASVYEKLPFTICGQASVHHLRSSLAPEQRLIDIWEHVTGTSNGCICISSKSLAGSFRFMETWQCSQDTPTAA